MKAIALASLMLSVSALAVEAQDSEILTMKMHQRAAIIAKGMKKRSSRKQANDLNTVAYFLGYQPDAVVRDIRELDALRTVRINQNFWSGYFWPNFHGGLGYRFADSHFPTGDWKTSHDYVLQNSRPAINLLSPAEKYDVLMGVEPSEEGSLTSQQWRLGQKEYQDTGKVETWQGICHGWSPAAITFPSPSRPVTFSTRYGNLVFGVDDIRALGALLFANGNFEAVYMGVRCNTNDPDTDGRGRVMTPECFDVNPADWHLIVTHQLGYLKQPFIIDLVNSSQVWNKPVIAYTSAYYDIADSRSRAVPLEKALRPIASARTMRNGNYRNPLTAFVVGVGMTITYLDGSPVGNTTNKTKTAAYLYDLELDDQMRIIGGEWVSKDHPDFAWKPKVLGILPSTAGDATIRDMQPWEIVLNQSQWRQAALQSNVQGAPLMKFVNYLFDYSAPVPGPVLPQ